LELTSY